MNASSSTAWVLGVRTVAYVAFVALIVALVQTNQLGDYVAPRMMDLVKGAALVLAILAIAGIVQAWGERIGWTVPCPCGQEHRLPRRRLLWMAGLFFIPLCLGYFSPDQPIGSAMVARKGLFLERDTSGTTTTHDAIPEHSEDPYVQKYIPLAKHFVAQSKLHITDAVFVDASLALDLFRMAFVGKPITVSGFVHREPDMGEEVFVVARLAMACCAADALPYGFMVSATDAGQYQNDTWVTVSGVLRVGAWRNAPIITVHAQTIAPMTDPPETPFLEASFDDIDPTLAMPTIQPEGAVR